LEEGSAAVSALLELEKVTIKFGGLTAVSEVDMQVGEHELAGLIRAERSGKNDRLQSDHRGVPTDFGTN
jgi:ABC-type branched-subunit amino acid transport system ATPase component